MIALAADQRHSAPDEEKPRNGGNIINTTIVKFRSSPQGPQQKEVFCLPLISLEEDSTRRAAAHSQRILC